MILGILCASFVLVIIAFASYANYKNEDKNELW